MVRTSKWYTNHPYGENQNVFNKSQHIFISLFFWKQIENPGAVRVVINGYIAHKYRHENK